MIDIKTNKVKSGSMVTRLLALSLIALGFLIPSLPAQAERTTTYYVSDALGSPIVALDEQGEVLWRKSYLPYGKQGSVDPNDDKDTAYTGKKLDRDTGLIYFGARWYDPDAGRFTGVDPVGFKEANPQSFNRYAYANNNPYLFVDPDGREPFHVWMMKGHIDTTRSGLESFNESGLKYAIVGGTVATGGVLVVSSRVALIGLGAAVETGVLDVPIPIGTKGSRKGVTNPSVAKLPRPPTPNGMTQNQFGRGLIGWGKGPQGALEQLGNINASSVAKMKQGGLTREMATQWRDFYKNEFNRNANNTTAANRVRLMDKILDNF